jgi:hypothetical protein
MNKGQQCRDLRVIRARPAGDSRQGCIVPSPDAQLRLKEAENALFSIFK